MNSDGGWVKPHFNIYTHKNMDISYQYIYNFPAVISVNISVVGFILPNSTRSHIC